MVTVQVALGELSTVALHVEGMTCSSCAAAIETALHAKAGIGAVAVSVLDYRAVVHYSADMVGCACVCDDSVCPSSKIV